MIGIFIIIIILIIIAISTTDHSDTFEPENQRVGRQGERIATNVIKTVLRDDDLLFTNVEITYDGKPAELDNVVVNSNGVFIIEVKNYSGLLVGNEDDFEWMKYKTTDAGNTYEKTVRNPIKQVKRQVYVLAKYLEYYGLYVWIEGYAYFVQGNSPVRSSSVLTSINDIDRVIHTPGRNHLSKQQVYDITNLF